MECKHKPRYPHYLVFDYKKKAICRKCGVQIKLRYDEPSLWIMMLIAIPALVYRAIFDVNELIYFIFALFSYYVIDLVYCELKEYEKVESTTEAGPSSKQ